MCVWNSNTLYSLIAIGLTDIILESVARSAVALVVLPTDAANAAVRVANGLATLVGQLVTLGTATDFRFCAIVTRIVAAAATADGATEATCLVQRIPGIALATPVEEATSILAAQRAGEHTIPIVVLHESLIAIALAGRPTAAIGTAANGSTHSDPLEAGRRITRATDLEGSQLIGHICLYVTGVLVFVHHVRANWESEREREKY